jgi:hypothetical protein
VKYIAKFGVLLLATMLAGTPVLACMLPGAAVTAEESACCRHMASQCGQGKMPSSHSCCKTLPTTNQVAIAKASFNLSPQLNLLYIAESQLGFAQGAPEAFLALVFSGHSPPEAPPSSSEILRI